MAYLWRVASQVEDGGWGRGWRGLGFCCVSSWEASHHAPGNARRALPLVGMMDRKCGECYSVLNGGNEGAEVFLSLESLSPLNSRQKIKIKYEADRLSRLLWDPSRTSARR